MATNKDPKPQQPIKPAKDAPKVTKDMVPGRRGQYLTR